MKIVYKQNDITFELNIHHRVCVLFNTSGDGKTFLFRSLQSSPEPLIDGDYIYINYLNYENMIKRGELIGKENDLIVFDNSDLYTEDLLKLVPKLKSTCIIITKTIMGYPTLGKFGFYKIEHTKDTVSMIMED